MSSRSLRKVLIRLPQGQKSAGLQLCRGVNPATKQRVVFVSKIVKDGPAGRCSVEPCEND